ncbi:MAG: caspase family protein [Anaerolineae bacterium]|nr:caspase family protein [Anaerolineae bacterium]
MTTRGLFIGIDEYKDTLHIHSLQYAVRDAASMNDTFKAMGAETKLLTNSQATALEIRREITKLAHRVQSDDTAIIYFAGHGARDRLLSRNSDRPLVPFLIPHDAFQSELIATAIPIREMIHFLEMIPARATIFIFDSCYSGASANSRTFELPGIRDGEASESVFREISGEGTVILAASRDNEPSFEDHRSGHGIFTACLLDALSGGAKINDDGRINLDSIFSYLQTEVPKRTQDLYNSIQIPMKHGTILRDIAFPSMPKSSGRTLESFPFGFLPISIVVGDRREAKPKTAGDILALPGSSADLRWILSLGLPKNTEIISDKIFRQGNETYLREHFGQRNLLIIGSPAVNHLAQIVNETAFFPFADALKVHEQTKSIRDDIDKRSHSRSELAEFISDANNLDRINFYMNEYQLGGFIDPTFKFLKRGAKIPNDRDYGTITLCRNPYSLSGEYVSILVGGVHLPGTMHALPLLAHAREEFKDKPLGGVFHVELAESLWEDRVAEGKPFWSTEAYTVNQMRAALTELKDKPSTLDFPQRIAVVCLSLLDQLQEKST